MTFAIATVLAILIIALILFVTEWLPMDVTALLVLGACALTGLVSTQEALAGFANPAVVTVWAMFILSDGLTRTGIADLIGRFMLKWSGESEARTVIILMVCAGGMSAFMNNIGVAALLLPVVIDIADKTGKPASRLLMPLAYGSLLGGLTTLIGTPPNLLVSDALRNAGHDYFGLFDYAAVGVPIMIVGTLFVAFFGRRLLPTHYGHGTTTEPGPMTKSGALPDQYGLAERTVVLRIPEGSSINGRTLRDIRFGSALELSVVAVLRDEQVIAGPSAEDRLFDGDKLLVQGRLDRLNAAREWSKLFENTRAPDLGLLTSADVSLFEVEVTRHSAYVGKSLLESDARRSFGVNVLAIRRGERAFRSRLDGLVAVAGDRLLIQGRRAAIERIRVSRDFRYVRLVDQDVLRDVYHVEERLFSCNVPQDSPLVGQTLAQSRLGEAFGFMVMAISNSLYQQIMPGGDAHVEAGDEMLVQGPLDYMAVIEGLGSLELVEESPFGLDMLEGEETGFAEVVLAPRSTIAGRTIRELHFYDRYGLQLLAIWRAGRAYRSGLRNIQLQFGDAFLLFGSRRRLSMLKLDRDFVLLTSGIADRAPVDPGRPPMEVSRLNNSGGGEPVRVRPEKAPWAASIMAGVLLSVLTGVLPIAIASVIGVAAMVISRCMSMDDAYRAIEWRAVFLIAGMIPLAQALDNTGAAAFLAQQTMAVTGQFGVWPVLITLYLITAVATTIVPTAALVLMMAPITMKACIDLGVPPQMGMMAVAMAASASFTSPISHPANILVMGPGGYRFVDYLKLGVPLALVVMITTFIVLPFLY